LNDQRVIALVPMRHTSERVPGKNYRLLAGRPLFHHVVEALLSCRSVSEVVIDTDSEVIRENATAHFPDVTTIDRPLRLRGGDVPMNEILLHDVDQTSAQYFLQTHSTNPFLRTETISAAIDTFFNRLSSIDSLFSVTRLQSRLWGSEMRPINHDPRVLLRTQDLPPIFEENSCLYIFSRSSLMRTRNRIGNAPIMFEISGREALDIDEPLDFEIAECIATSTNSESM
jgi:CMP-N-acetylneuraminic acid synthetase